MKFPLSKRDIIYKGEKVPGPGSYSNGFLRPTTAGPKYVFGKSLRDDTANLKQAPGPGSYNAKSYFE